MSTDITTLQEKCQTLDGKNVVSWVDVQVRAVRNKTAFQVISIKVSVPWM